MRVTCTACMSNYVIDGTLHACNMRCMHITCAARMSSRMRSCAGPRLVDAESAVEEVQGPEREQLLSIPGWRGVNNPWMPGNDTVQDFSYINLLANPERYTGYQAWPFQLVSLCCLSLPKNGNVWTNARTCKYSMHGDTYA